MLLLFSLLFCFACAQEPSALYLTFLHDPATSMTIQWHSEKEGDSELLFGEAASSERRPARGHSRRLPFLDLAIHTLELLSLKPDTLYSFHFPDNPDRSYTFRTLPQRLTREVRFVVGGDAYFSFSLFHRMNQTVARLNPDFAVIGGDIAYTAGRLNFLKGKSDPLTRWLTFFHTVTADFTTPSGRIIPIVPVAGNHDVSKKERQQARGALLFDFFAFPRQTLSYRQLDLGNYASLLLLDTGHYAPIEGPQTLWLEAALLPRKHLPYLFAAYHVAAYPSYYRFTSKTSTKVRSAWAPLFEQYRLTAAFEHHNHTYKRTYPLLGGEPHPLGVPYLGDGSWGVPPRSPSLHPYLAKTEQDNAVWLVTLSPGAPATATSYRINGQPLETQKLTKK